MDRQTLDSTRRSLHGLAELVLAGPQWKQSSDIRLRVVPGGFATVTAPDLRVEATGLVTRSARIPFAGSFEDLAAAAGVQATDLRDVYADGPHVSPADPVEVDEEAARIILDAFARGDAAMRSFAPAEVPVLWPEHFDVGIAVREVNYGVSPGDGHVQVPYAYVGPWAARQGAFWNMPFGAARPIDDLPNAEAVAAFFAEGSRQVVRTAAHSPELRETVRSTDE
jgi:hypothetical protein